MVAVKKKKHEFQMPKIGPKATPTHGSNAGPETTPTNQSTFERESDTGNVRDKSRQQSFVNRRVVILDKAEGRYNIKFQTTFFENCMKV